MSDLEDRRAKLLADKAVRDRARAEERAEAEVQGLELEAKFEAELGRRGEAFEMVDASTHGCGWIVVKLGEDLLFRNYVDAVLSSEGGVDAAELYAFVSPNVAYPSLDEYSAIVRKRGAIANRCADALASLHGAKKVKAEGKF